MSVRKIEALLDGIAKLNGMSDPTSDAYKLRNPLLVKSFARPGKHDIDEQGRRIFPSLLSGYKAGLFDLETKISGQSRAKVKADSTIEILLACYGINNTASLDYVVSFLRRALDDQNISRYTIISYFMEQ